MANRSINEVVEAAGTASGDFLTDTASAARGIVCNVWRVNPVRFAPGAPASFSRGLMQSLCPSDESGTTPPPAPAPRYSGGQCCNTFYSITTVWENNETGASGSFTQSAQGVPGGWSLGDTDPPSPTRQVWKLPVTRCDGQVTTLLGRSGNPDQMRKEYHAITNVAPQFGGPDDCGDPEPRYPVPTDNAPYPDTNSLPPTITVPSPDGIDFTLPIVYAPLSPTFEVNPKINIDIGGIPVTIDFGGFTFDFGEGTGGGTGGLTPEDLLPLQEGIDSANAGIGGLDGKLDDLKECACPEEPEPPTFTTTTTGTVDSLEVTGINLKSLNVTLSVLPDKAQFGGSNGRTCFFAGWCAIRYSSGYAPREQINFSQSSFQVGEGATGFTITFTNKARGRITYIVENG